MQQERVFHGSRIVGTADPCGAKAVATVKSVGSGIRCPHLQPDGRRSSVARPSHASSQQAVPDTLTAKLRLHKQAFHIGRGLMAQPTGYGKTGELAAALRYQPAALQCV